MTDLREFQLHGVEFLKARNTAFLCDDAGLGKSAQVLRAADDLSLSRILCVGPAAAGVSWPQQRALWSPHRKFIRITSSSREFREPGFYFSSYDLLSRSDNRALVEALASCARWDALVIDEGQNLKTRSANRTKAIYGVIRHNAERVWVLSGTLTPNHAGEAWTHLRALAPDTLKRLDAFEEWQFQEEFCRYRDTVYGRQITGSRNVSKLREAIAPHVLRRRKEEVLTELPALEFFTAPIEADREAVERLLNEFEHQTEDGAETEQLLHRLTSYAAYSTARRLLGLAKVKGCAEWLIDRLEAGEKKLIVFAHHREVLTRLCRALVDYGAVLYDGNTPAVARAEIVEKFQHDPACRVFVGQIGAAGTAITLTTAKTVLLAEYAGTPGVNYQAASRAHRMGQRDGVQAYFATVPDTLDEALASLARRRAAEIAELFD